MELDGVLRSIWAVDDLPRLVAAWGHLPLHEAVPSLVGGLPRGTDGPAVVVGKAARFPWFAVSSPAPDRTARRLARWLGGRGRIAGVLALDAAGRRLAVSVALDGSPTLTIDLDRPSPAALASLGRMAGIGEGGALAYAARVADALATEDAGRRFFREFSATLDRVTVALPATADPEDRRSFVLLQLTRVLFLYFVQAKGWLAGRERFLAEEVDRCLAARKHIHRNLLRPLFFGTLNRPIHERGRAASRFGAIPFLNGGLFEPHPLEQRLRRDIPNSAWRDAFDRLFERFHFTISEGTSGGDIAPDMLGRVFEGVMSPSTRRASGTYYTPATLVEKMLQAAMVATVATRLDCSEPEAGRLLDSGHARAAAAVAGLTILDPAVGSGAFLLGALERLTFIARSTGGDESERKRRVLQRNLFGVDRSATAVRLAELRLWLAVIADDHSDRPSAVRPLPNLDCLMRQGDSLFEPAGCGTRAGRPSADVAKRVGELRQGIVTSVGRSKRPLVRELREMESRAAAESFAAAEEAISVEIAECLRVARARDLFGDRRGLDAQLRARIGACRDELRSVRTARRTVARERELPWFHYQSHFPDVFARGGFDLVVGNPPWLRAEEVPREQRGRLAERYRWWGRGSGWGNRPDLAVAFLERAFELAKPGGTVALLLPAKLGSATYGAAARHALASTATLVRVADLTTDPDAAFDATVYPLALVARREPAPANHRVLTSLAGDRGSVPQSKLRGGGPWMLTGGRARRVLASLGREHPRLRDSISCHLGLKTGANAVFLDPPDTVEPHLIRRAIRGRDVRPFLAVAGARLLYTHGSDGRPFPALPRGAAAHLAPHEEALRARADFLDGSPWTLFRTRAATARHRVVWADLDRELSAAALTHAEDREMVPLNTCYIAVAESEAEAERLAAWLNSTWIRVAARMAAVPAAGGFVRFASGTVGQLPLPTSVLRDPRLETLAVAGRGGIPVQHDLDDLTAQHLALSAADRDAIRSLVAAGAPRHR